MSQKLFHDYRKLKRGDKVKVVLGDYSEVRGKFDGFNGEHVLVKENETLIYVNTGYIAYIEKKVPNKEKTA